MVNNMTISDPLGKTEALKEEILNRYTAEDDLRHHPDQKNADTLPWSIHLCGGKRCRCNTMENCAALLSS
jgi:hypothetical protein